MNKRGIENTKRRMYFMLMDSLVHEDIERSKRIYYRAVQRVADELSHEIANECMQIKLEALK